MKLVRVSWVVVVIVLVASLVVPALREQWVLAWDSFREPTAVTPSANRGDAAWRRLLAPYRERATEFVARRYPSDPQMVMAAGLLAKDAAQIKRAAEMGKDPAAWSAYASYLVDNGPKWDSIAMSGTDPEDAKGVAEDKERIAESGLLTRLTRRELEPIFLALRNWQDADPGNAMPVALESMFLYQTGDTGDALTAWAQAGRMKEVTSRGVEQAGSVERLLADTGMPAAEAVMAALVEESFSPYAHLRSCARIATYEGRLAQMNGRAQDAITWWQSTVDIGGHMQETSDTNIGALVGSALVSIGAGPVWRWVPDTTSGLTGGPLYHGRFFWGEQHEFYVREMGPAADEELRDTVVRAKARSQAMGEQLSTQQLNENVGFMQYLSMSGGTASIAATLFVLFLVVGVWRRRVADEATALRPIWQFVVALLIVAPIAAGSALYLRTDLFSESEGPQRRVIMELLGSLIAFCALLIIAPILAALLSRAPGARFRTAWRGTLRRVLPVAIALLALLFVPLSIAGAREQAKVVARFTTPGKSEMAEMVAYLGDRWTNPTIPPDSWRAEYPPEKR